MEKLIVTLIVELLVITPIIIVSLNRADYKWKHLLLFVFYYLFYFTILFIPSYNSEYRIIDNTWNWSGKIYAITSSILFYAIFRKSLEGHNYITFKQNDTSLKPKLLIIIIIFFATIGLSFFAIKNSETRLNQLLFQFTMPGIDEELAFRGIMLGLLSNLLKPKISFGRINLGNPALLITSILFGLAHSFEIDNNWVFHQNWFEFINMFAVGLFLGWMTIKSGSIFMPILSHNLINTLPKIFFWI